MLRTVILSFLVLLVASQVRAQDTTANNIALIGATGSFNLPFADMAKRYGFTTSIGASFFFKTKSNILIGAEYNYLFGNKVKENALVSILTSEGYIINSGGTYQPIRINERGHLPMIKIGKIFPIIGANQNSGIYALIGAGIMEHKIKYYFPSNMPPPQMSEEYYKGYDRLSNGLALSQSIGFLHLATNRLINFSAAFEVVEGFTQGRRDFQYDLMRKDDAKRLDVLVGLRLTWYFPIRKKAGGEYHY